jgi:hypothetical protein
MTRYRRQPEPVQFSRLLADEIAGGTINKVMAKSDLELGIEGLHRDGPI